MAVLTGFERAYLEQIFARAGAGLIPGTWLQTGTVPFTATVPGEFEPGFTDVTHEDVAFSGTVVTLPSTPAAGRRIDVFVNGVLQRETAHYTVAAATITFTSTLAGDDVVVKYAKEP